MGLKDDLQRLASEVGGLEEDFEWWKTRAEFWRFRFSEAMEGIRHAIETHDLGTDDGWDVLRDWWEKNREAPPRVERPSVRPTARGLDIAESLKRLKEDGHADANESDA